MESSIAETAFCDFSSRDLLTIPDQLLARSFPVLQYLYLSHNDIGVVPPELFLHLPNLKWLDLRDNKIHKIPDEIGRLHDLRCLLLDNNQIRTLPKKLAHCRELTGLHLSGNPIEQPPPEICRNGCDSILKWLRNHDKGGKEKGHDAAPKRDSIEAAEYNGQRYDLWATPSKTKGSWRKHGKLDSKPATDRRIRMQRSAAYLSMDESIRLRMPSIPSEKVLRNKARLLEKQRQEQIRKASTLKQIEIMRKQEVDDQWRGDARRMQHERSSRILSGEMSIPPIQPPFAMAGDSVNMDKRQSRRATVRNRTRSTALSVGDRKSLSTNIDDIRGQIAEIIQRMNNSTLTEGDGNTEAALEQAKENLLKLQDLRGRLEYPTSRVITLQ